MCSTLLRWFGNNRRDLPWRRTHDPYLIAVSEVMLQQTQVDRVKPKYLAWRQAWPTTKSLAEAPLHDVLKLWSGLGYNSRAKRLRDSARAVMERFGGKWPRDIAELESLPGFGPYTARAVASFSYNVDTAVIDTNVRRVMSRIFFGIRATEQSELDEVVEHILPRGKSSDWNAALMDFGSAVCTSRSPKCKTCPMKNYCRAYPAILDQNRMKKVSSVKFQDSDRYLRGQIIKHVIEQGSVPRMALIASLQRMKVVDKKRVVRLMDLLVVEGLVVERNGRLYIAS